MRNHPNTSIHLAGTSARRALQHAEVTEIAAQRALSLARTPHNHAGARRRSLSPTHQVGRITSVCFVNGTLCEAGNEIRSNAWPRGPLVALNEAAERVAAFFHKRHGEPMFPTSPYVGGKFYLPSVFHRIAPPGKRWMGDADGSELIDPVPAREVTPEMPKYRVKKGATPSG
jgi:hypothetical protein